jgi:ribokinase
MTLSAPLVVVGSANADMFVEVDRLPKEGETIAAKSGQTFAGGKGANQASCAARLSYPTYFVGQVGKDGHASLVRDALTSAGVRLDHMNTVKGPTGHALVMLQPGGKSSIVLVQGANVSWPRLADGINRLTTTVQQLIRRAGAVLLQREVPDSVNMEAAKVQNLGLQFLIRKNLSSFFCCCTFLFLSFCCHIVSYKRLNHNQRQDAFIRGCIILATS